MNIKIDKGIYSPIFLSALSKFLKLMISINNGKAVNINTRVKSFVANEINRINMKIIQNLNFSLSLTLNTNIHNQLKVQKVL